MGWAEWVRGVEVEPSLYAADFARLGDQIESLLAAGTRVFHFDVGDAHFVEPVTIGPIVLQSIAPIVHAGGGVLDCHLMVDDPEHHLDMFRAAGGDSVTFHFEATPDPVALAAKARERGLQVGLAFKPETAVEDAARVADAFDLVLCMSIHPGYSGQTFMPEAIGRIEELRARVPDRIHVQVDGGIGEDNIRAVRGAGADLFVCGSSLFGDSDPPAAYQRLVRLVG